MLQPSFDPSVAWLCHPLFATTNLSYRFPIVKVPPPPLSVTTGMIQIDTVLQYISGAGFNIMFFSITSNYISSVVLNTGSFYNMSLLNADRLERQVSTLW